MTGDIANEGGVPSGSGSVKQPDRPRGFDPRNIPSLVEGEKVVAQAVIHPAIYWKGAAVLILGIVLLLTVFNLGVLFFLVGLFMLGIEHLTRLYLMLVVTNRRVMIRHGIFIWVDTAEMRLSQIESIETNRMLLGQLLGYGSIIITGTGNRATLVPYVANAGAVRRAVDEILMQREARQDG